MSCRIKASPKLYDLTEWSETRTPGQFLDEVVKGIAKASKHEPSVMKEAADRAAVWLNKLMGGDLEEVVRRLEDADFNVLGVVDGELKPQGFGPVEVLKEEIAPRLVATEQILQSHAEGLVQMADVFVKQVEASQVSLSAAQKFAQQAMAMVDLRSRIVQGNARVGRDLLLQKLATDAELSGWARNVGLSPNEIKQAYLDVSDEILNKSLKLLNSGDDQQIAMGMRSLKNYADLIRAVGSPEARIVVDGARPGLGGMIWTVAINGLLSSPRTLAVNMASITYAFGRPAFQMLGGAMGSAFGIGPGGRKAAWDSVNLGAAQINGMLHALGDASKLAWISVRDNKAIYGGNPEWSRNVEAARAALNGGWNAFNFQQGGVPIDEGSTAWHAINVLGNVIGGPSRLMQAGDDLIKHVAWRGQVHNQGMIAALRDGVDLSDKEAIREAIEKQKEITFNMGNPDFRKQWELRETFKANYKLQFDTMNREVLMTTFQEENAWATGISQMLATPMGKLARPFIPFVRTPLNILKQGFLTSTPLGATIKAVDSSLNSSDYAWRVLNLQEKFAEAANLYELTGKDPEKAAQAYQHFGQVAFTTALFGGIYALAARGQMIGGGPRRWGGGEKDPAGAPTSERQDVWLRAQRARGFTDAYQFKLGNTVVPFSFLGEPFVTPLKMAADLFEYSGYMTSQEQDEAAAMIVTIMSTGLFQQSFVQGIDEFMKLFMETDPDSSKIARGAANYVNVFTPMGSLLNYIETIQDPYKSYLGKGQNPWGAEGEWEKVWRAITAKVRSRIPGLSDTLPTLYDPIHGEPVPTFGGVGSETHGSLLYQTVPILPRGLGKGDELDEKIHRASPDFHAWRPPGRLLTPHEEQAMNRRFKDFRINGKTKAQAMEEFFSQPDVTSSPVLTSPLGTVHRVDPNIVAGLREIERDYGQAVFDEMLLQDPTLQQRVAQYETLKRAKEGENGGQDIRQNKRTLEQLKAIAGRRDLGIPQPPEPMVIPQI